MKIKNQLTGTSARLRVTVINMKIKRSMFRLPLITVDLDGVASHGRVEFNYSSKHIVLAI